MKLLFSNEDGCLSTWAAAMAAAGVFLAIALPTTAHGETSTYLESFESALQPREDLLSDDRVALPERILDDVNTRATLVDNAGLAQERVDDGSFARQAVELRFDPVEEAFERSSFGHEGRGGCWLNEREYDDDPRTMPVAVPEVGRNTLMITGFLALAFMARRQARGPTRRRQLTLAS